MGRMGYLSPSNLLTKNIFAFDTSPSFLRLRLRFLDFFVSMCRLKDF